MSSVTSLAVAMAAGAPDDGVLTAWRRLSPAYSAPALAVLLAHLHPGNMRVDIVSSLAAALLEQQQRAEGGSNGDDAVAAPGSSSSSSAAPQDPMLLLRSLDAADELPRVLLRTEPHSGTRYAVFPAGEATVRAWRSPTNEVPAAARGGAGGGGSGDRVAHAAVRLCLPPSNPFVPTDLSCGTGTGTGTGSCLSGVAGPSLPPHHPPDTGWPPVRQLSCGWVRAAASSSSSSASPPAPPSPPPLVFARLWQQAAHPAWQGVPRAAVRVFIRLPALCEQPPLQPPLRICADPVAASVACPPPHTHVSLGAGLAAAAADPLHTHLEAAAASAGMLGNSSSSSSAPPLPSLALAALLLQLHVEAVLSAMADAVYLAGLAGLELEVRPVRGGLELSLSGFAQHLPRLLRRTMVALCGVRVGGDASDSGDGSSSTVAAECPPLALRRCIGRVLHSLRTQWAGAQLDPEGHCASLEQQAARCLVPLLRSEQSRWQEQEGSVSGGAAASGGGSGASPPPPPVAPVGLGVAEHASWAAAWLPAALSAALRELGGEEEEQEEEEEGSEAGAVPRRSPEQRLVALLQEWSGHGECSAAGASCCSWSGTPAAAAPAATETHRMRRWQQRQKWQPFPLWLAGSGGAGSGAGHPSHPILVECLVAGDVPPAAAARIHAVVTDHVCAAAAAAAQEEGEGAGGGPLPAWPPPLPPLAWLYPPWASPALARALPVPRPPPTAAAASASVSPASLCISVPASSSLEASSIVTLTLQCPPVPLLLPPLDDGEEEGGGEQHWQLPSVPHNLAGAPLLFASPSSSTATAACAPAPSSSASGSSGAVGLPPSDPPCVLSELLSELSLGPAAPPAPPAPPPLPSLPAAALRQRMAAEVLARLLHGAAFDALRTQAQLGYLVYAEGSHGIDARPGNGPPLSVSRLSLVVRSASHAPGAVAEACAAFLRGFRATLAAKGGGGEEREGGGGLDDTLGSVGGGGGGGGGGAPAPLSPFLRSVAGLVSLQLAPPAGLGEAAEGAWRQLREGTYGHAAAAGGGGGGGGSAAAAALRGLSLRAALSLWDATLGEGGGGRMLTQVVGARAPGGGGAGATPLPG